MARNSFVSLLILVACLVPRATSQNDVTEVDTAAGSAELITLSVRDTPLSQVIEMISVRQQVNIVAGVDLNRTVTVNFFDASLEDALNWILSPVGLGWYFDGQIYTILSADQISLITDPLVEEIFYPNYRSAAELQVYLLNFLSPFGTIIVSEPPKTGIEPNEGEAGGIDSTSQEMLIVIDNESSVEHIKQLFKKFDIRPRQVLVEAVIIEVVLDETNRFGVDFSAIGDADLASFESALAPQQVYSPATLLVPGALGAAGLAAGAPFITPSGVSSVFQQGFTAGPGSDGLRVGFVGTDVAMFLDTLQSVADTNVLANTKVLALNKMPAEIIIGGRLGYLGASTISDGLSQQTVEFLEVGTQLRFRPFIGDDGFVRLEIHPERSSGIIDPVTGLPSESTSEVTTNVMVRDDETVVIGGLIESREVQTVKRVPLLGYLPWIGWLFSSQTTEIERREVIVMITPRILEDGEIYEDGQLILNEAAKRSEIFLDSFGPIARATHAERTLDEARSALAAGRLREARSLCDRVMQLSPLKPGVVGVSDEIDALIADDRRLSADEE
jgi:type II secretory pathway component GspD/PulD (secretin)